MHHDSLEQYTFRVLEHENVGRFAALKASASTCVLRIGTWRKVVGSSAGDDGFFSLKKTKKQGKYYATI